MIEPGRYNIAADRWVACIRTLTFIGYDFTGGTFLMQVRAVPDVAGTPPINLSTVTLSTAEGVRLIYGGTATVTAHIAAGRMTQAEADALGYSGATSVTLTQLGIRINETTMEGMPFPDERGDDWVGVWDMHITPSGGIKDKYIGGDFTVRAGATQ